MHAPLQRRQPPSKRKQLFWKSPRTILFTAVSRDEIFSETFSETAGFGMLEISRRRNRTSDVVRIH